MTSGDRTNCYALLGAHILHMHKEHTHFLPFSLFHTHTHTSLSLCQALDIINGNTFCLQRKRILVAASSSNGTAATTKWNTSICGQRTVSSYCCCCCCWERSLSFAGYARWQHQRAILQFGNAMSDRGRHMAWRAHFNGALINDPPPLQKLR